MLCPCRYEFIQWPSDEPQELTKRNVFKRHKFPNCSGFIDGCHIQILAPEKNPVDYYSRKEIHSVILQAVCDENLKFININLGQTGRAHDARVFRESDIGEHIQNLLLNENHILGDSAYTLSSRILTPYRGNGHLSEAQKYFNKIHSGTRAYIERAFGLLKGKFRRLKYLELHKTDNVSTIICATCVLHNFILLNELDIVDHNEVVEHQDFNFYGLNGIQKRDEISAYLLPL